MSKPRHRNILLRTIQLVRRNINRLRRLTVLDEHLVHKRSAAPALELFAYSCTRSFSMIPTYTPWSSLPVSGTSAPARSTMFSTVAETFRPASDASVTFADTFAFGTAVALTGLSSTRTAAAPEAELVNALASAGSNDAVKLWSPTAKPDATSDAAPSAAIWGSPDRRASCRRTLPSRRPRRERRRQSASRRCPLQPSQPKRRGS